MVEWPEWFNQGDWMNGPGLEKRLNVNVLGLKWFNQSASSHVGSNQGVLGQFKSLRSGLNGQL